MKTFRLFVRDLTFLTATLGCVLAFSQIPAFIDRYADNAETVARAALNELPKRYPQAERNLGRFIRDTLADADASPALRDLIVTAQELEGQRAELRAAPWWEKPVILYKNHHPGVIRTTWQGFTPSARLDPRWGAVGLVYGWLSFAGAGWLLHRLVRQKPRP